MRAKNIIENAVNSKESKYDARGGGGKQRVLVDTLQGEGRFPFLQPYQMPPFE